MVTGKCELFSRGRDVDNYLAPSERGGESLVSRVFASWNQLDRWLRQVEGLRRVA
jgi:hypothetical protein